MQEKFWWRMTIHPSKSRMKWHTHELQAAVRVHRMHLEMVDFVGSWWTIKCRLLHAIASMNMPRSTRTHISDIFIDVTSYLIQKYLPLLLVGCSRSGSGSGSGSSSSRRGRRRTTTRSNHFHYYHHHNGVRGTVPAPYHGRRNEHRNILHHIASYYHITIIT